MEKNNKIDTQTNNFLKKYKAKIFNRLGIGKVLSVAYDTAWLARVPDFPDISKPAFPQALTWLRQHQLTDGSWGAPHPYHAQDRMLSTLAAILAISQWQNVTDQTHIQRGMQALQKTATTFSQQTHDMVGFELILPALIHECQILQIHLPPELANVLQHYQSLTEKKKKLIISQLKKSGPHNPASWWFSLEMLSSYPFIKETDLNEMMLFHSGSIAASPAATAYFLRSLRLRGKDSKKAFNYLNKLIKLNQDGGAPNVSPIDEFELAFSINYFLEAGISPENSFLKPIIKLIKAKWQYHHKTGFAYSSDFFIDPDDSAVGMKVLAKAGYKKIDVNNLLKFFNGTCMENFAGERLASISANLHSLAALRLLQPNRKIKIFIKKITAWLKAQLSNDNSYFLDKWHSSAIYPMSRAIIALEGLDNSIAQHCVSWLIRQQRPDGGWGWHGESTGEESAFASLALSYWHNHGHIINASVLQNAKKFLNQFKTFPNDPLWIGKVLYCPTLVVASLVTAAQYALSKIKFSETILLPPRQNNLNNPIKIQLPMLTKEIELLRIAPIFKPKNAIKISKKNKAWAVNLGLYDETSHIFKADIAQCSTNALRDATQKNLQIYTDFGLFLLTLDDILDETWQKLTDIAQIKNVFNLFLGILKHQTNPAQHSSENNRFPKLHALCLALENITNRLPNKISHDYFLSAIEIMFTYFLKELTYRKKNQQIKLENYLQIRNVVGGMDVANELAFLLQGIKLDQVMRDHEDFLKLKNTAYRALIIVNDLLSFDKERNHDDIHNYIVIAANENHCSTNKATEQAINHYNQEIGNFFSLKETLSNTLDPNHRKYFLQASKIIADQVQAHLDWAMHTNRYHKR